MMRKNGQPGKAGTRGGRKGAPGPESNIRRLRFASAVAFLAAFLLLSLTIGFGFYEVRSAHADLERVVAEHQREVRLITDTQVASFRRADADSRDRSVHGCATSMSSPAWAVMNSSRS